MKINAIELLIILIAFLKYTEGESWKTKLKKRMYDVNSLNTNDASKEITEICKDEIVDCENLRERGLCKIELIQMKCKSTCGLCAPSPPIHCSLTKHGCCWDNHTKANSSNKGGCPACVDKFDECKYFKNECEHRLDVRLICPITCGINCNHCRDSKHQAVMCPSYKKFGFCRISPDLMERICARTCNFCPLNSV